MAVTSMSNSSIKTGDKFDNMSPITNRTAFNSEFLVVGGGGGGGGLSTDFRSGGGGGAGGFVTRTQIISRNKTFNLVVGAGGTINSNGNGSSVANLGFLENLVATPSMEDNQNKWVIGSGSLGTSEIQSGTALFGTHSLKITSNDGQLTNLFEDNVRTTGFSVGDWFTYSAYFLAGTSGRQGFLQARFFNSANSLIEEPTSSTGTFNGSTWTRISFSFQIPANTARFGLNIKLPDGNTGTTFVDGIMLQKTSSLNQYVDYQVANQQGEFYALGGGGGGHISQNGFVRGSGGGAGGINSGSARVGGGSLGGQGFSGGDGTVEEYPSGGGGGGANQAGENGQAGSISTGRGGNGGNGIANSITGTSVTRGGGGGGGTDGNPKDGGTGGTGGGANGASTTTNASAAGINLGGGGGGSSFSRASGGITRSGSNGGSGVVIIKIPDFANATFSAGVTQTVSTAVSGFKVYTVTATSTTSETVTIS